MSYDGESWKCRVRTALLHRATAPPHHQPRSPIGGPSHEESMMGVIATALQHMIAVGMPGEQVVRAVAAMEVASDTRSAGAKRQARYRERNKGASMATACVREDDMESAPLLPLSFNAN